MPVITVVCGLVLVGVGLWGYRGTSAPTALIPAGIGAVLVGLGLLALKESLLKHAMHAAAAVGLLSFVFTAVMGLPRLVKMLAGGEVARPKAVISQSITAGVCGAFVALFANSFLAARRRRKAAGQAPGVGA